MAQYGVFTFGTKMSTLLKCSLTTQCGLPLLLSFTIDLVFEGELCNDCKLCNLSFVVKTCV